MISALLWFAGGFVSGAMAGIYVTVMFFAHMHNNTLPPQYRKEHPMKIHLVEDWRNAWRWVSVNCMVLAGALQTAWLVLDADQRASLPPYSVTVLTIAILACGVIGRLTKQNVSQAMNFPPIDEPKP